jgi:O-antigen/teichoic acid export membrane protein/glycosyltransferase involved in cell wall biosynthesis
MVLVRILSPDEIGLFRIFFLYLMALPTFSLASGLLNGLAYWSGQDTRKNAINTSVSLLLTIATLATIVLACSYHTISTLFGWQSYESILFALATFGAIAGTVFEETAISSGLIWHGALYYACYEFVRTFCIVITAMYYKDLSAVLVCHTLLSTLKVIIGIALGSRLNILQVTLNSKIIRQILNYAIPVSLAALLNLIVNYFDKFTLSAILNRTDFAIYSIGCLSLGPILVVEHSITRVLIPQLAACFGQGNCLQAARLYSTAVRQLGLVFIPSTVGLILFAEPIINLLYTPTYSASSAILKIYALTYLMMLVPFDTVARAKGDSRWPLTTCAKLAFLSLPITLVFTFLHGSYGALFALLLSNVILRVATIQYSHQQTGWDIGVMLPWKPWLLMLIVCLLGSCCALSVQGFFSSKITWFLFFAPVGAIVTAIAGMIINNVFHSPPTDRRVLFLVQTLNLGGIERLVTQIAIALKNNTSHTPLVVAYDHSSTDNDSLINELKNHNVQIDIGKKPPGFSLNLVFSLVKYVFKNHVDIIHVNDIGGLIYASFVKILTLSRVNIIMTQHSFTHLDRVKRYKIYEKLFSRLVDRITVVNETLIADYVALGMKKENILLIPNGINFPPTCGNLQRSIRINDRDNVLNDQIQIPQPLREAVWILYLARLFPKKGQDNALTLWSTMNPAIRKQACLIFLGPDSHKEYTHQLQTTANRLPDASNIIFAGPISNPFSWLNVADGFISCSEYEGMPLACIEAIGSGLPTLLSNIPGHRFLHEYTTLFDLKDMQDGAHKLEEIIKTALLPERSYQEEWNRSNPLRNYYSFENMLTQYIKLYESL